MQPEMTRVEMTCPLNGAICNEGLRDDFKPNEKGIKKQCRWWTHIAGKDPQTEKQLDHYDCAMAWVPVVVLESSQMTRHMTATTQEFRNETHEGLAKFNQGLNKAAIALQQMADQQREMLEGVPLPDQLENKNGGGHDN
jgi:hypothetical protein